MEYLITDILEGKGIDKLGKFYRFYTAHWTVNGNPYTTIISDEDFKAGRTNDVVSDEAKKIIAVLTQTKK